jgi:hypothetical protein
MDTREESGGFDLVKVETDEPLKLTALLRERNFPSMWRGDAQAQERDRVHPAIYRSHGSPPVSARRHIPLPLVTEATMKQEDSQGYGFISSGIGDFPYWGHGGGALGNSLVLDYYPMTNTSFICMSNRDPPVCDRLAFNAVFRAPRTP